jgi:hypothetical protein
VVSQQTLVAQQVRQCDATEAATGSPQETTAIDSTRTHDRTSGFLCLAND